MTACSDVYFCRITTDEKFYLIPTASTNSNEALEINRLTLDISLISKILYNRSLCGDTCYFNFPDVKDVDAVRSESKAIVLLMGIIHLLGGTKVTSE